MDDIMVLDRFLNTRILINNFAWNSALTKIKEFREPVYKIVLELEYYLIKGMQREFLNTINEFNLITNLSHGNILPYTTGFQILVPVGESSGLSKKQITELRRRIDTVYDEDHMPNLDLRAEYLLAMAECAILHDADNEEVLKLIEKYNKIKDQIDNRVLRLTQFRIGWLSNYLEIEMYQGSFDSESIIHLALQSNLKHVEVTAKLLLLSNKTLFSDSIDESNKTIDLLRIEKILLELTEIIDSHKLDLLKSQFLTLKSDLSLKKGKIQQSLDYLKDYSLHLWEEYSIDLENILEKNREELLYLEGPISFYFLQLGMICVEKEDIEQSLRNFQIEFELRLRSEKSLLRTSATLIRLIHVYMQFNQSENATDAIAQFNEIYGMQNKFTFVKHRIQLAEAMVLSASSNVRSISKAIMLLEDVLGGHRIFIEEYKLGVFYMVKLLIHSAINYNDDEAIPDALSYLSKLIDDSKYQVDDVTIIQTKILQSKLELLDGNHEKANQIVQISLEIAERENLLHLIPSIKNQKKIIDHIYDTQKTSSLSSTSFAEEVIKIEINEYLNLVLKTISNNP